MRFFKHVFSKKVVTFGNTKAFFGTLKLAKNTEMRCMRNFCVLLFCNIALKCRYCRWLPGGYLVVTLTRLFFALFFL